MFCSKFIHLALVGLIAALQFNLCLSQEYSVGKAHKEFKENILNVNYYDKHIKPNGLVKVQISMHIIDITLISEESMLFKLDFYLRQMWNDIRLTYEPNEYEQVNQMRFNTDVVEEVWKPDTFIANAKQIDQQSMGSFSRGNSFIRISSKGQVFYSHRLTATVNCANKLNYFPSDKPICRLEFESYGFNASDIEYSWMREKKQPVSISDTLSLQAFLVQKDLVKDEVTLALSTGTYSRIILEVHLNRRCGYYLNNIYLPAAMLVIISWMSFCLDGQKHQTARLAISVLTCLSIVILMVSSVGHMLPKHYSIRAIEVYLFGCLIIIVLAMIRTVFTGSCPSSRSSQSYKVEQCQIVNGPSSGNHCSRIIFPILFLLFNIAYGLIVWYATN